MSDDILDLVKAKKGALQKQAARRAEDQRQTQERETRIADLWPRVLDQLNLAVGNFNEGLSRAGADEYFDIAQGDPGPYSFNIDKVAIVLLPRSGSHAQARADVAAGDMGKIEIEMVVGLKKQPITFDMSEDTRAQWDTVLKTLYRMTTPQV